METHQVVQWINTNVRQPRETRSKHLWLWGKTELGKSAVLNLLTDTLRYLYLEDNNKWTEGYEDGCYDILCIDEFWGKARDPNYIKKITVGHKMSLPRRGTAPYIKHDNLPVFITAQQSIGQTWPSKWLSPDDLDALDARFLSVKLTEKIGWITLNK